MTDIKQKLPKECCKNIGNQTVELCGKDAKHFYVHGSDICSFCDDHDYVCGVKIVDKIPNDARVYHSGQQYHKARKDGTGTVRDYNVMSDGTFEYLIEKDDSSFTWWASYMTVKA